MGKQKENGHPPFGLIIALLSLALVLSLCAVFFGQWLSPIGRQVSTLR